MMVDASRDIPEITVALARFVADITPYVICGEPSFDLRALAKKLQVLPVYLDMGGCFGVRPNSEVVSFTWDEPRCLCPVNVERVRNMVFFRASRKYPELAFLMP
jgi:hypothetical protein